MRRYFLRKLFVYALTFVAAVTIDWAIPHLMPGNPVLTLMGRIQIQDPQTAQTMYHHYMRAFNLDLPLWKQYWYFWVALFHGDLGTSIVQFPASVKSIIIHAVPYTLGLLLPATLLSWYAGNKVGALAARRKVLDNTALPLGYALTATPYMWLAILLSWSFAVIWKVFPVAFAYDPTQQRAFTMSFVTNLAYHWFLPFMSLFLVSFGGWAIGMRNMIIYELESDYAHYLEALGAPQRLVRRYAFRNAVLPQVTGLALSLGAILAGALVTEIVFSYPGLGFQIFRAITNADYFVIQGIFLFIIVGVLIANFLVDLVYVLIDPRTRIGMEGGRT
ncbi:MAG: ABC transporter permease [Actinomycetota bacterium]